MPDFTFSQAIILGSAAAVVTAISSFLIARNRNRHEVRLKELDSKQKKQDFQYSVDLDNQKRRAQAAETIVKQWSLLLNRIELQSTFYKRIAKDGYAGSNMYLLAQKYTEDMASITKRMQEEGKDVSDLIDLYFGIDPTVAEAVGVVREELDLERKIVVYQAELKKWVENSIALMGKMVSTQHPITYMALDNANKATERAVVFKVRQILEILEAHAWVLRRGIAIVRTEMKYPEIK
ncbi:hypothetical protein ACFST9_17920 [Hymenobacter monticola]|uniref:Uncharacterized protein n=1 Tax=Hymenobacter monticola TaxID=1705399 RepID=A0ABY4B694_9BACT|nr:hypothetical protein [Hymenobacter monticola]UOE32215.1 hypothetical protein MTP16_13855 [Hymenobacter monticola]